MKKILSFVDNNILRFFIALAILFIPLYPKLPSIGISHVWVYIRLEDFLILLVTLVWLIQLVRKKVSLPRPEGYALVAYWVAGLVSLVYCLLFLAAHLQNFFPLIATLEYFRRVEYMILFFAAFSSVKRRNDIIFYLITLGITVTLITLYGFGQKFYPLLWSVFPSFFKQYPFCFPAFLTGNEEFAKGTAFCLDSLSRITSTFGGQYDLAAYLVFVIPVFIALFIVVRRWYVKTLIAILVLISLEVLNFTSSRTSFAAYMLGAVSMLIFWKKKWWIIPVLLVSVGSLFILSNSTLARFEKTIQPVQILQIQPGTNLGLEKIISTTQQTSANSHPQSPPPGTVTVGNQGGNELASGSAQVLTEAEIQALEEQNINISTVSGSFLLKKAYALDISFTTRFQGEWPRDWQAFLSSPIFGTGYSSLTLASDNDYLRALGETGLIGTLSFIFIFIFLGIFMKNTIGFVKDPIIKALLFGLAGGTVGLLINATLIDVFEASKVAEPYWILLGIALGGAKLYQKEPIPYKKAFLTFFTSQAMIVVYIFLATFIAFGAWVNNFFVADDFVWLHWAATAVPSDLPKYFIHSGDFFYRPLDKIITYFLYSIFSFQPQGYHLFTLFLHFLTATGVYFLAKKLSGNKLIGALTALLFILHPAHAENIFWISTLSDDLSTLAIIFTMLTFIKFREKKSVIVYILAIVFGAIAFASYEIAVVLPFILIALDIFILKPKKNMNTYLTYLPFALLFILYFVVRVLSHSFFGGGDYSYHLSRMLPNIVGNFFGYTGIFVGGLPFLIFYNFLRLGLRTEWVYFTVVAVLLIGYLIWMYVRYREKFAKLLRHKDTQLILFCFVFAFIALLPFLPLGNIAPRYLYLASVGYALALVLLLKLLFVHSIKNSRYATYAFIVVCLLLAILYFIGNMREGQQWRNSGHITQDTLIYFRKNYPSLTSQTDLYFVNTPVMLNNTWVFPVGLTEGLWFIYRDNLPRVHQVVSLKDAPAMNSNSTQSSYTFFFDAQGRIKIVK
jgi:hypothetical protein